MQGSHGWSQKVNLWFLHLFDYHCPKLKAQVGMFHYWGQFLHADPGVDFREGSAREAQAALEG